jgi:hypothetical protein
MTKLSTEQLIYLLCASAYAESLTVTKSTVKSYLSSEHKKKAASLYDVLQSAGFIKPASKGRFSVTEEGVEALVMNLAITDYQFDSVKGPKILNALLTCIRKAAEIQPQVSTLAGMTFDEFHEQFKLLYFKVRKQQSLQGVIAIRKREISKTFIMQNSISQQEFEKHFEMLRVKGEISVTEGGEDKLIEWTE